MRPCDCKDQVTAEKLNEQGIKFNDDELLLKPSVVILKMYNVTLRIPMHRFKQLAEWYLTDQEKE